MTLNDVLLAAIVVANKRAKGEFPADIRKMSKEQIEELGEHVEGMKRLWEFFCPSTPTDPSDRVAKILDRELTDDQAITLLSRAFDRG